MRGMLSTGVMGGGKLHHGMEGYAQGCEIAGLATHTWKQSSCWSRCLPSQMAAGTKVKEKAKLPAFLQHA